MSILVKAMAAGAAAAMLAGVAGVAQAQPGYGGYGYGEPPPPPYQEVGGGPPAACGRDNFTLLGAHAGVTVLGLDLGASAHLGVPVDGDCGQGAAAPAYEPRPYAPPEPAGYAPPPEYGPPPSPCGEPACGQPQYDQPQYGQPQYAQPEYPPVYAQPAYMPQPWGMQGYAPAPNRASATARLAGAQRRAGDTQTGLSSSAAGPAAYRPARRSAWMSSASNAKPDRGW